jgi:hypothetical protein
MQLGALEFVLRNQEGRSLEKIKVRSARCGDRHQCNEYKWEIEIEEVEAASIAVTKASICLA